MQTSDQSSREEQGPGEQEERLRKDQEPEANAASDREREAGTTPAPALPPQPGAQEEADSYDDEAVRQGLLYPPPVSFYAKKREAPAPRIQRATTPEARPAPVPVSPYPYAPTPGWPEAGRYPPGHVAAPYGVQARRQSFTGVWILVALIVVLVLSACALFAWLSYSMFGTVASSASDATTNGPLTINMYYQALQEKNYKLAYSYLSPTGSIQGLTEAQFAQRAQQRDTQNGPIYTYQTGDPNIKVQGNQAVTSFTISVDLSRGNGQKYTVHLTLQKVGSQWKIADFDQI